MSKKSLKGFDSMTFKRLIAFLLTCVMFLSSGALAFAAGNNQPPPNKASAEQKERDGSRKPDKGSTVTRKGNTAYKNASGDFTIEDGVLKNYSGSDETVTIPSDVTSISSSAFSSASSVKKIVIPSSVTSINTWAFDFCSSLEEFSVNSSNQKYASSSGILFNKDYTELIRYPRGKTATSYTVPSTVTKLGDSSFYKCTNLTGVTLQYGITGLDQYAFAGCTALTGINLPTSITSINYRVFSGCSGLTSITIPNSVSSISSYTFSGCSGLTKVTIPSSVKTIGSDAFENCTGLTSISIPTSVTTINSFAFEGCTGLTSATIPSSVSSFSYNAFRGCTGITSLYVNSDNENYSSSNGILYNKDKSTLIVCPEGKTGSVTVPSSVTSIGNYSFYKCKGITGVYLPNSVTNIAGYAFFSCTGLTSLTMSNSVTSIGNDAFYGCTGLTSIYIPGTVTSIGSDAFYTCSGLTSISIPSSVTSIGSNAFYGCAGLTKLTIPSSVTSLNEGVFSGCSGLTSLTISNGIKSIGKWAFSGCTGLTSVDIPASVTSISERAFLDCFKLSSFTVASSNANYCTVNGVIYTKDKTSVISYPPNKAGTSFTIPNTVKTIIDSALSASRNLTSVTIPSSVTTVGDFAFEDSLALKTVTIYAQSPTVGTSVFSDAPIEKINYAGTQSAWEASQWKEKVGSSVTVAYNYSTLTITTQPTNKTVTLGNSLTVSLKASGTGLTYQWYFKKKDQTSFSAWKNHTGASETCTPNETWDGMKLYCIVKDAFGATAKSNTITVTLNAELKITTQPTNKSVVIGSPVTVSLKASGIGLTYQWYFKKTGQSGFSLWSSHTKASETCTPNDSWNGIQLYCIVKDSRGSSLKSNTIKVTVYPKVSITQQPVNKKLSLGTSVTLSLKATGGGLTYQWYFKKKGQTSFSIWSNHTHASETCTPNESWNGIQLYCIVKDMAKNTVRSNTITVTVTPKFAITQQPTNQTIMEGDPVTVSLKASGTGLTYQWYYKKSGQTAWSAWNGRTHASETCTPNLSWNGIQLYCRIKDTYGQTLKSNIIKVTVYPQITITVQPVSKTVRLGKSVTISLKAEGVGLTYQWYYKKVGQSSFSKWNGRTHASETVTPPANWNGIQLYCKVSDSNENSLQSNIIKITVTN